MIVRSNIVHVVLLPTLRLHRGLLSPTRNAILLNILALGLLYLILFADLHFTAIRRIIAFRDHHNLGQRGCLRWLPADSRCFLLVERSHSALELLILHLWADWHISTVGWSTSLGSGFVALLLSFLGCRGDHWLVWNVVLLVGLVGLVGAVGTHFNITCLVLWELLEQVQLSVVLARRNITVLGHCELSGLLIALIDLWRRCRHVTLAVVNRHFFKLRWADLQ